MGTLPPRGIRMNPYLRGAIGSRQIAGDRLSRGTPQGAGTGDRLARASGCAHVGAVARERAHDAQAHAHPHACDASGCGARRERVTRAAHPCPRASRVRVAQCASGSRVGGKHPARPRPVCMNPVAQARMSRFFAGVPEPQKREAPRFRQDSERLRVPTCGGPNRAHEDVWVLAQPYFCVTTTS